MGLRAQRGKAVGNEWCTKLEDLRDFGENRCSCPGCYHQRVFRPKEPLSAEELKALLDYSKKGSQR